MPTTAAREQRFYDTVYGRFRDTPESALAVDRVVMRRTLDDPTQPVYERRRLYGAVLDLLLSLPLKDAVVLDYGCGPSDWGVLMATEGARVTLLDLSPMAIELGLRRARASGVNHLVQGVARDASNLSCFTDGQFDFVYASAAVHHTLKYPRAFEELVRVIRPGGTLVLAETYGVNALLNAARRVRASLQREEEEQGEEIIFSDREVEMLRSAFRTVEIREMNLLAMGKRFLRGRLHRNWAQLAVRGLEACDLRLLHVFPSLRRHCGEVLIVAIK